MANRNAGGNARKSLGRHLLDGTFRKDRHGDYANPEPTVGCPEVPGELDPVGQAEWGRMMGRLEDMRCQYRADDGSVWQYCRLFSETEAIAVQQVEVKASLAVLEANIRDVEKVDLVQLFSQIVTLTKIISKCTDQLRQGRMALRQYLVEFGLTPASRGRIKLPPKQAVQDEFSAFQKGRSSHASEPGANVPRPKRPYTPGPLVSTPDPAVKIARAK